MKEQVEIPHQYQRRTIVTQTMWTRQELVGHVAKRAADPEISYGEVVKDASVVANIIKIQATHLQETSRVLAHQTENFVFDLRKRNL